MSDLDDITTFLRARLGPDAQIIDTHISRVVIGGERAYKIKKPVAFSYLDFSTREKRAAAAETEVAINRRTAPAIYLGLRRISRAKSGALELDGAGETIETIVEMRSFDQADLFDQMAQRGALTAELMTRLTEKLVAFHRDAAPHFDRGGADGMADILALDEGALAGSGLATPQRIAAFERALRDRLAEIAPALDARRAAGKVRRCHGDLTLRNICLFAGEPTPFDAIEFDERLATIDILYDLAFLLMDLTHRGLAGHANLVFNRYLDDADETDGLPALPLFMAVRASIRAHVTATQARTATGEAADRLRGGAKLFRSRRAAHRNARESACRCQRIFGLGQVDAGRSARAASGAGARRAHSVERPDSEKAAWRRPDRPPAAGGLCARRVGARLCRHARRGRARAGARRRRRGGCCLRPAGACRGDRAGCARRGRAVRGILAGCGARGHGATDRGATRRSLGRNDRRSRSANAKGRRAGRLAPARCDARPRRNRGAGARSAA
ncbi:MAG: phosphotransferase [Methylobacteriaceae bacterium]|nr:phosphotransferase [Methylobacteriaceae bacterium]